MNDGPPWPGFVAAFLILLGFALFTPLVARPLGQGLAPRFAALAGTRRGPGLPLPGRVALSRSAVSIAALACALGMLIAVTVMIGSFRQTVNDWVSRSISGDIFFGPSVFSTAAYDRFLPPEILPELQPGPGHRRHLPLPRGAHPLSGPLYPGHRRQLRGPGQPRRPVVPAGGHPGASWAGWARGPGAGSLAPTANPPTPRNLGTRGFKTGPRSVVISEPLAETFASKEGERLILPTPAGPQDLTSRRGLLRLPHRRPQRLDGHPPVPPLLARHPRQRGAPLSQGPRQDTSRRFRPGSRSVTAAATASSPCPTVISGTASCGSSTRPSP